MGTHFMSVEEYKSLLSENKRLKELIETLTKEKEELYFNLNELKQLEKEAKVNQKKNTRKAVKEDV